MVPERGTFLLLVGFLAFNPASTFATTLGQLGEQSQPEPTFVCVTDLCFLQTSSDPLRVFVFAVFVCVALRRNVQALEVSLLGITAVSNRVDLSSSQVHTSKSSHVT